jgi:sarcosine oxidase subunit beta
MTDSLLPHYDVIIIGAGSVGVPAAMNLAKNKVKTLVIDQYPSVGQGSNKRAIGGIRATHSDPAKISLSQRSIQIFSTWKDTFGDDIEWVQGGYCFVAYAEKEEKSFKSLLDSQHKFGLNIDWLDKKSLLKVVPDLNPNGLIGGTFSPEDGNASPLLALHAFYDQASKEGAEFHFNEKVKEIKTSAGKIQGVSTDQGEYAADVVINAAGGWAEDMDDLVGIKLPVHPDSHEAAITEPVERFLDPMIVDVRPEPGSANYYFYQHTTGQIIFCITPSPSIWGFDTRETSRFLPMVSKRMINVMPRLKNIRVRRTWRGTYPMTPDGFPIIGWSKAVEGYLLATGMCGQGFMLGPGVGELLERLVSNHLTAKDNEVLSYVSPYREFVGQEQLK